MKKVAVILSGCGVYDGSEITEAVLSLLALDEQGAVYTIFAPDKLQTKVVNHISGQEVQESRNVLVEAARIARGQIKNLELYNASDFDALILPGGFGAALNLSTYAKDGDNMLVDAAVSAAVQDTYKQEKPIAALCIAPVIIAKLLSGVSLTIGSDPDTAGNLKSMGAEHITKGVDEFFVDEKHKIYTTPCYMLGDVRISDVAKGIRALVKAMLS